jgi:cell division protein FtsQ
MLLMKKMNRAVRWLGYGLAFCGMVVLLGFIESTKSGAVCEGIEVEFVRGADELLITEDFVRQTILDVSDQIVGQNLRQVNFDQLEDALNEIPFLNHVVVYTTIDNQLKVRVTERKPIARLIDENGKSALLDSEGFLLPVSRVSALRLPVFTGDFKLEKRLVESNMHAVDSLASPEVGKAFEMGELIFADSLWKAQFQHLSFESNGDLIAFPQVGNHTIIFGSDRFEEKLEVLRIFYREGMSQESWNKYKSINLKYKDQIVCTKKYPYGGT